MWRMAEMLISGSSFYLKLEFLILQLCNKVTPSNLKCPESVETLMSKTQNLLFSMFVNHFHFQLIKENQSLLVVNL